MANNNGIAGLVSITGGLLGIGIGCTLGKISINVAKQLDEEVDRPKDSDYYAKLLLAFGGAGVSGAMLADGTAMVISGIALIVKK